LHSAKSQQYLLIFLRYAKLELSSC